ncbi:protein translocase subunit SecDF [Bacillus mangrovi]|uniref:Multifunctional fusion protein n=1 Tax=Metabacillus mangrovi TaxID=1491830 RepID=A0A7X2S2N6_9BACI|nr:protein translocase subunit SecDF [Metabacillus mangrovi]
MKRGRILAFFLITIAVGIIIGLRTDNVTGNIPRGLDLQGGFEVLYDVKPVNDDDKIDREALVSTVRALENRANVLGVSEPNIQIEGERIRVQLAGVKDQNKAREILSTEARLTFRDVNDKEYLKGSDLVQGAAKQTFDPNSNQPVVSVKLKDKDKFADTTEKILSMAPENQLVIWLDYQPGDKYKEEAGKEAPKFLSAPNVDQVLDTTDVIISGQFTIKEAQELAELLNAGSLPVQLDETYSTSVGAKFGEEALQTTVLAGIIGVAVIFIFMVVYYRFPGVIAIITLSAYIFLILQLFDWMNGVLTLPGIAALILGVGMAVDANIITYERIKEELKLGKSVRSAFKSGNRRSFVTILDANLTTMLAGAVLFFFGTSAIKGFATMLLVSIAASFITAVFLSRILLSLLVESRWLDKKKSWFGVKKSQMLEIYQTDKHTDAPTRFDKVDFLKHRNKFFAFSGITVAAGLIILIIFKLNLGIDFTSGTRVQIDAGKPVTAEQIEADLEAIDMEADEIVLAGANNESAVARFAGVLNKEEIAKLKDQFNGKYNSEPGVSTVSPEVGQELARNALYGVLIASLGIVIYVAIRYEWRMGISAIAALLYDAFFIIAFFSLTRLEVDLTFIAAILTIVGYSINDTIVTFDRIRELQRKTKVKTADDLDVIVNKSLQQTFTRSVNTVLTVVITTVALLIFGSESIRNFSIALLVGLISGAYSSIFIAAQLWLILKKKEFAKKKEDQTKEMHTNQHPEV